MGCVYLAYDPSIDRRVALKVLPLAKASDPLTELERRFVLEARAAGRLNHPGIVSIYDTDIDYDYNLAYIAMEWVDGRPLSAILAERERLPIDVAAQIVNRVAKALEHAHSLGVIHRDIKPANIIIARDGRVKVLDFGIAKLAAESHTTIGQVVGTPAFMAPEQLQGHALDGRCDLFSLGAVLFLCLSGRPPFWGQTVAEIVQKVMNLDPLPLVDADVEVPESLWRVVAQALEKNPGNRFESGHSFATALKPFLPAGMDSDPSLRAWVSADGITGDAPGDDHRCTADDPAVALDSLSTAASWRRTEDTTMRIARMASQPSRAWWKDGLKLPLAWRSKAPVAVAAVLLLSAGLLAVSLVPATDLPPTPRELVARPRAPLPTSATAEDGQTSSSPENDQPSVPAKASLVVSYRNRLKSAWMSIWVDGEKLWSEPIKARGRFLGRARGDLVEVTLPVLHGRRTIEVRLTGAHKNVDASRVITGIFDAGESRNLRAKLHPLSGELDLSWRQ